MNKDQLNNFLMTNNLSKCAVNRSTNAFENFEKWLNETHGI